MQVVAECGGIHDLVEAGVARHLAGIREVELAKARANLPGAREANLRAQGFLKREIQVGAIGREGLLRKRDNAALRREEGFKHLPLRQSMRKPTGVTPRPGTVV